MINISQRSASPASVDAMIAFSPALFVCLLHVGLAIVSGVVMPVILAGAFSLYFIQAGVVYLLLSCKLRRVLRRGLILVYGVGMGAHGLDLIGDIIQAAGPAP